MKDKIVALERNGTWALTTLFLPRKLWVASESTVLNSRLMALLRGISHCLLFLVTHRLKVRILLRLLLQLLNWLPYIPCWMWLLLKGGKSKWTCITLYYMVILLRRFISNFLQNFIPLMRIRFFDFENHSTIYAKLPIVGFLNYHFL